jgi:signal transduction histidine kinase
VAGLAIVINPHAHSADDIGVVNVKPPTSRSLIPGAELFVALALVFIAIGLIAVVATNLGTSADIRKESRESHLLAEMQTALIVVEEAVAAWQVDPTRPHPAVDPEITASASLFDEWRAELADLVNADEIPVIDGFSDAFNSYVQAARGASATPDPSEVQTLIALDLAARRPLLDLLEEENDHLLDSVEADRRAEIWLRWGSPVLLILALLVMTFVFRLRDRGRQLFEQRRINDAQTEFIASVSHELRTPLTSVVAYSHELRDRFEDFSPGEIDEMVQALVQGSDEVAAIVDDLLVAARIETDHLVIRPEPLDIREEIGHALATIADVANIAIDAEGEVLADRGRLRQILRNLVSNAVRYGGDRIRVSSGIHRGEMLIVVADSGPPVPVELHTEIFEPFNSPGADDEASTSVGLGLAVSRHLATLMGGSLWYSHEDGWSRLDVRLPLPSSTNGRSEVPEPTRTASPGNG